MPALGARWVRQAWKPIPAPTTDQHQRDHRGREQPALPATLRRLLLGRARSLSGLRRSRPRLVHRRTVPGRLGGARQIRAIQGEPAAWLPDQPRRRAAMRPRSRRISPGVRGLARRHLTPTAEAAAVDAQPAHGGGDGGDEEDDEQQPRDGRRGPGEQRRPPAADRDRPRGTAVPSRSDAPSQAGTSSYARTAATEDCGSITFRAPATSSTPPTDESGHRGDPRREVIEPATGWALGAISRHPRTPAARSATTVRNPLRSAGVPASSASSSVLDQRRADDDRVGELGHLARPGRRWRRRARHRPSRSDRPPGSGRPAPARPTRSAPGRRSRPSRRWRRPSRGRPRPSGRSARRSRTGRPGRSGPARARRRRRSSRRPRRGSGRG